MAFVPYEDFKALDEENARLLNRLTIQQEINQSLREENFRLKAELERKVQNETGPTNPSLVYICRRARNDISPGKTQVGRVILRWIENGVEVEKMLMRQRSYHHSHKGERGKYAPAPRGGVEKTEHGWRTCDPSGNKEFIRDGKFIDGHFLADFRR